MFTRHIGTGARLALRNAASSITSRNFSVIVKKTVAPALSGPYASPIRNFTSTSLLRDEKLNASEAPTTAEEEVKADQANTDPLASTSSSPSTSGLSTEPQSESALRPDEVYVDPLQSTANETSNDGANPVANDPDEVSKRTVYVGGLSWNVDNEWLKDEVHKAIESTEGINSVRIARDPTGRSKGFAFIEFTSPEIAQQLVSVSPIIDDRQANFQISSPQSAKKRPTRETRAYDRNQDRARNPPAKTLWLGNVAWETSEEDIRELMEPLGEVTRIHMPVDRDTQRMRGIAYVDFGDVAQAEQAFESVQQMSLHGRGLKVDFAAEKKPWGESGGERRNSFSKGEGRGGDRRGDRGGYGGGGGGRGGYGGRGRDRDGGDEGRPQRYERRERGAYQPGRGRARDPRDEGW